MDSYEVLKEAVTGVGAKSVASDMALSTSLIYKWCEPSMSPSSGGAENPMDRLAKIYDLTEDPGPIQWLCEHAGGFFVKNPPTPEDHRLALLPATQKILKEFSELLNAVSRSADDDGEIDTAEAARIRKEWEDLKQAAERFVVACESGNYQGGDA